MSEEIEKSEEKYIATPKQIAEIVSYCLGMTIHGNGGKNWLNNVLTSIDGINGVSYGEKVKLEKYQSRLSLVEELEKLASYGTNGEKIGYIVFLDEVLNIVKGVK